MAIAAAIGLDEVEPLLLGLEIFRDAVALVAGAGEAALVGDLDHRGPVDRRIILRRRGEARRDDGGQVEDLARLAGDLLASRRGRSRAPRPGNCAFGRSGIDVAAALVGDDHLGEAGAEIPGLGDDPDSGFGPNRLVTIPPISSLSISTAGDGFCCALGPAGSASKIAAAKAAAV